MVELANDNTNISKYLNITLMGYGCIVMALAMFCWSR